MCQSPGLTLQVLSSIVRTKAVDSMVQERTVSVRPSLNMRVIEDSYVRQNSPLSYTKGYIQTPMRHESSLSYCKYYRESTRIVYVLYPVVSKL